MLELKNIKKSYTLANFTQTALNDVSLKFRKNEFVAILGQSGSGKTTLLNIIGGLDHYDSGDLIINNKSTKKFKDTDWDAYRNNCIGFIFQSYNLISHISILSNVELGMTLSGVSKKERRQKAIEVLKKVGLENHINKKPNQLSGGQMQRVAIARALVNNPDIILADEPTGALDSKTSVQIMELIKEIAKDKLVIMVTHNSELAHDYANRIIELKDGNIISDTNKLEKQNNNKTYTIKKTAMSFFTALSLSFNNIKTKKGRTLLTAFASSIGIIGISIILSLSNGFDMQIDQFEKDTLSSFPITISRQATEMTAEDMMSMTPDKSDSYIDKEVIYPYDTASSLLIHQNVFTDDYLNYINNINPDYTIGISYLRTMSLNMLVKNDDKINYVNNLNLTSLPKELKENEESFLESAYDLLKGSYPEDKTEIVIAVNEKNRLEKNILEALGIDTTKEEISFDELIGKEIKIILNDDFYINNNNYFVPNMNYDEMYNEGITLKIVGIVRGKEDNMLAQIVNTMSMSQGVGNILYSNELAEYIIEQNKDSLIVKAQQDLDYNILTGEKFTENYTKDDMLTHLGAKDIPFMINIYPVDFEAKENIINYLNDYNKDKSDEDKIVYTDLADTFSTLSSNIMDAIGWVLIAFSGISLIVSSIMIGIITYISVLERTKEIGILRSLGARKKDVSRVFNAETFIIGLASGLIGIVIARLLLFPINTILKDLTNLDNVAVMNPIHTLILITVAIILTLIGGLIPAVIASKKNPVEALRTE